jgi:sortase A
MAELQSVKSMPARPKSLYRNFLSLVFFVLGTSLLLYVGWAYAMMWHEQRTLARQWQVAHQRPIGTRPIGAEVPVVVDDGLVRVVIPKADIDAIVLDGIKHRQLAVGPGHLPSTPMPGENGNSVISAHRDTFFRKIVNLQQGDDIIVRRAGQIYYFTVTGRKIVVPTDVSVLRPTPDAQLTLITCYPTYLIGPAPKRLIVTSRLVRTEPDCGNAAAPPPR